MQKTRFTKSLSFILCIVLITAIALFTTACNDNTQNSEPETTVATTTADTKSERKILGEGEKDFIFTVTDKDGKETEYEIHTDKTTVGDALLELDLIAGEDGDYGLYVKTVDGITVDYDTDGKYWAFYVNGEYASGGVDSTKIIVGDRYSFKVE